MNIELINGFWASTDIYIGSSDTSAITQYQINNVINIWSFFVENGWSVNAIAAVLGNMQVESLINPNFTETRKTTQQSNNDVLYYQKGLGLVQWTTTKAKSPDVPQKLVNYAVRNNFNWYDGWAQLLRIKGEREYDLNQLATGGKRSFFYQVSVAGVMYDFENFPTSTASVSNLTKAWLWGYERASAPDIDRRIANAQYWYSFLTDTENPPEPVPVGYPLPADPDEPLPPEPLPPDQPEGDIPFWLLALLCRHHKQEFRTIIRS